MPASHGGPADRIGRRGHGAGGLPPRSGAAEPRGSAPARGLALQQRVAPLELRGRGGGDRRAPVSRFTRAWMARCGSPVRRARAATSAPRSARRRSRRSWRGLGAPDATGRGRRRRRRRGERREGRRRRGLAEELQRVARLGGLQHLGLAVRARPQRAERVARLGADALDGLRERLGRPARARARGGAPPPPGSASRRRVGSAGMKRWLICPRGARRAADEAADDLAEEQLGARAGGVDADAQPRDVDALGDHQDGDQPAARCRRRSGRSARPASGASLVTTSGASPATASSRRGERVGVLLVGRHHEPAGVGMVAGADALEAQRRRRAGRGRSSRRRGPARCAGAAPPRRRGRPTAKSAARRRPSLIHSMSPS